MTPEDARIYGTILLAIQILEILFIIFIVVVSNGSQSLNPSPAVIYYFKNCNNLTLYPQGCQVLS